jgi:hypothetical protein
MLGTLLIFVIGVPEALYRYGIDERLLFDGEMGYPIGMNLADSIWVLVAIPILGLPFGVIGAAVGRRWRRDPGPGARNSSHSYLRSPDRGR